MHSPHTHTQSYSQTHSLKMSAIACKPACKAMSFKASKASVPLARAPVAARMQVWQPDNNK